MPAFVKAALVLGTSAQLGGVSILQAEWLGHEMFKIKGANLFGVCLRHAAWNQCNRQLIY
jgi:hypothetical protein